MCFICLQVGSVVEMMNHEQVTPGPVDVGDQLLNSPSVNHSAVS